MNISIFVLLLGIALLGVLAFCERASAHDPYSGWMIPDQPGMSCCSENDCRATRSYMGDDERWRAWDGSRWLVIPPSKFMGVDRAGDGRSHLCERSGIVYCFTAGQPRG